MLVTTVTARAVASDQLSDRDYRDIFDELRTKGSLRAFVDVLASQYSIAWWSKYERDEVQLTRAARQELRRAVSLPALPPTVAEATAAADPDATVYQVGEQPADRIILVGPDAHDLDLHLNGQLTVAPAPGPAVTPVTRLRSRKPTKAIRLSPAQWDRLQQLRQDAHLTWDELADWIARLCGV